MASRKTTAEIAAGVAVAMTAIYSHLIETGYMDHSDIHWPPHQFPVWRQDVYEAWGLCPEAIEQLRLLPWPCTPNRKQSKSFQFYGNNRAVNYSHHDDVMPSRTAFLSGNGNARAVPLQFNGDVISIFTGTADVSVNVVLDVKLGRSSQGSGMDDTDLYRHDQGLARRPSSDTRSFQRQQTRCCGVSATNIGRLPSYDGSPATWRRHGGSWNSLAISTLCVQRMLT